MKWKKRGNCTSLEQYFLKNMGVSSLDEINEWFRKSYANKYRIDGLNAAVTLAKKYLHKPVTIVGDYDTDGVTATSILFQGLKEYGFTDVSYRIPLRFSEGFGISPKIIDEIDEGLIITCDNGIAGLDAIKKAKRKGLAVIVTDHHEPVVEKGVPILPAADCIIDPNALSGSADFAGYCGAGLAYRFICTLFNNDKEHKKKYLPLAAIGTIGDVMQLREENYVFVRNGLKLLGDPLCCSEGLRALFSELGLKSPISSGEIAYKVAPSINAASRMYDKGASYAVQLLTCMDPLDAVKKASWFVKNNERRKEAEKNAMCKAETIIEKNEMQKKCPIVLHIDDVPEGIIGIIAGRLCEKYMVPALVFTDVSQPEGKIYKGSARSCGDYNIKEALDRYSHLFIHYGGHAGAAGMSILPDNFSSLSAALEKDTCNYHFPDPNVLQYDLDIQPEEIGGIICEISKYAPYGEGNEEPVFFLHGFQPCIRYGEYRKFIGKDASSVKLHGRNYDVLAFKMGERFKDISETTSLDIIGNLSVNEYKGNFTNQIQVIDFSIHK